MFDLSFLSVTILVVIVVGLLLEERMAIRIIMLLEIALSALIGCSISMYDQVGSIVAIFSLIILLIAAVESILLFGFVILLYKLNQTLDMSKLPLIQF